MMAAVLTLLIAELPTGLGGGVAYAQPQLTGTFYGNDNSVYYLQQIGNQVWWVGESVDADRSSTDGTLLGPAHVWSRGIDSTSTFQGTVSGTTLSGKWVELTRGTNLGTSSITLSIGTDASGNPKLTVVSGAVPFSPAGTKLTAMTRTGLIANSAALGPGNFIDDRYFQRPDGTFVFDTFFDRYKLARKSIADGVSSIDSGDSLGDTRSPAELRPYRDQTVFYGRFVTRSLGDDEMPHVNVPSSFINSSGGLSYGNFACNANDGDLDFRIRVDKNRLPPDFPSSTPATSDPGYGWAAVNAADDPESESGYDHQDIIPKFYNIGTTDRNVGSREAISTSDTTSSYVGAEGVMYAGDKVSGCPSAPPTSLLFPGWAAPGGNSILVNSRPVDANRHPEHLELAGGTDVCRPYGSGTPLKGLNGLPIVAEDPNNSGTCVAFEGFGTQVRVTGGLVLDCGHAVGLDDSDDEGYDNYPGSSFGVDHTCDQGEGYDDNDTGSDGQNQEIHPFYALDIIECPLGPIGTCFNADGTPNDQARPNLTGAWGSEDGGTYYVRQMGNTIWWLGLTRNRDPGMPDSTSGTSCVGTGCSTVSFIVNPIPNPTNAFKGTISYNTDGTASISGQLVTIPKGVEQGGLSSSATFTVLANDKRFDLSSLSDSTFSSNYSPFGFPKHFDKLYEPKEDVFAPSSSLSIGVPQYQATSAGPRFVTSSTPFTATATDTFVNGDVGNDVVQGTGVQTVWYRYFPTGATPPGYTPIVLDQPVQDTQQSFTASGADGPYKVDMYTSDASGNDEMVHEALVTLDNTAPIPTFVQPAATTYTHDQTLTISYSVSDGAGSGVKSASATLDGSAVTLGQAITLFNYALGTPHTFTVTATDNVSNTASTSVVFTVIVTPQSIENDVNIFLANGAISSKTLASLLLESLTEAAAARAKGDCVGAADDYQAFINQVTAQAGKRITSAAASILIGDAQYLIANCP